MDTKDPNYAPDIIVELAGRKFILKAVLAEMKALQKRCGGLLHLADKMMKATVTLEELAAIIHHGAGGETEKVLSIPVIESLIFDEGMIKVLRPCTQFISGVLSDGPKGAIVPKEEPPKEQKS